MIARLCSAAIVLLSATITALPLTVNGAEESYEDRILRLAEILGAIHHLRDICGADEGQLWREQMVALLDAEDPPSQYRGRLIAAFNNSYRGFQRTYGACTTSAKQATNRFFTEGSQIAASLTVTLHSQVLDPPAEEDSTTLNDADPNVPSDENSSAGGEAQ